MNHRPLLLALLLTASCASDAPPLPTVEAVDLSRYEGTWFEIASIPVRQQRGCYRTTATYRLNDDGTVSVVNRCLKGEEAEVAVARGTATAVPGTNGSQLEVSFFGPFKGDYYVIALAPDYRYAMVGTPERDHLWILSREPTLDDGTFTALRQRAEELGFDTRQLTRTPHPRRE
ncbi:MAG: lipocalin family protein [Myxococcales bacterium]